MDLDFTVEERLLLCCARLHLSPEREEEVRGFVQSAIAWDQVLHKAEWHKLSGLLFTHLRPLNGAAPVPGEVMDSLRASYRATAVRNLYYRSELQRVLDHLRSRGIPVIVLKGAALAELVYGDPGLRPMADLDLLVPREQADMAQAFIGELGYLPGGDALTQQEMRAQDRQLPALSGTKKAVTIEVHSHIVEVDNPLRFDISGFWERAQEATIAGTQALTLSPEDALVHLAINFFKDRSFFSVMALGQLVDLAEVARFSADDIDWSHLVGEAIRAGLTGPVFCAFYLSRHLLDAPIPAWVLAELEPPQFSPGDVAAFARRRVLDTRNWVATALVEPGNSYRLGGVVHSMLRRVFPPRRYLAEKYRVPPASRGFYKLYFRRLGETLGILGRAVVHPGEIREDLSIDRWLHDLYQPQPTRPGRAETAPGPSAVPVSPGATKPGARGK